MDDRYSINRREPCPLCNGRVEHTMIVGQTPESYSEETVPCDHCKGKGFLKILKHDYDY